MKQSNLNNFLIITYIICAVVVFIENIFQPLPRWQVGVWIFMAGFWAVLFSIEKS